MTDPISDAQLDEIERRCNAASPGPWKSYVEGRDHFGGDNFIMTGEEDIYFHTVGVPDQDFIASARQDVPALIQEVRALRKALSDRNHSN
jgi:hypothetical protein